MQTTREIPTEKQKKAFEQWLSERPENIRVVAEKYTPLKYYKDKRNREDIGTRYIPYSYQEYPDGIVRITCRKVNLDFPILGGSSVFGIDPDNLIED